MPGELSHRGGILDLFAADWNEPVRIEFFGDTIESIRRFEVSSQRSLDTLQAVEVTALAPSSDDREHFTGYLPPKAGWPWSSRPISKRRGGTFSSGWKIPTTPTA